MEQPAIAAWSVEHPLPADRVVLRGRIDADAFMLEPVIAAAGTPESDPDPDSTVHDGPYRVRGFDDAGVELFDRPFGEALLAAVSPGSARHFMLVLDVPGGGTRLARVELSAADGRRFVREARMSSADLADVLERGEGLAVGRLPDGAVRVRWDPARFVLLQLHHSQTGLALGVGRDGEIVVATDATALDITLSDGVRSGATRLSAR